MAHFAQLNEIGEVVQVIVVNSDVILDEKGNESEEAGIAFCQQLYGKDTTWKQTSYNGNVRKNFAGIGYSFDGNLDAFVSPKPTSSERIRESDGKIEEIKWELNETTARWEAKVTAIRQRHLK